MPVGRKRRHGQISTNLCSESYAWIDAKFYHHGVTQQSHHRMENRDVARYQSCGLMGPRPWTMALCRQTQPTNV
jgi:hypothetical protein